MTTKAAKSKGYSIRQIAGLIGRDRTTITAVVEEIEPVGMGHKSAPLYSLPAVIDALIAREIERATPPEPSALQDARTRRAHALAARAELDLEREAGRLCDREGVERAAFEAARTVRDSFQNLPDRLASQLAAERDAATVALTLRRAINEALTQAADNFERIDP